MNPQPALETHTGTAVPLVGLAIRGDLGAGLARLSLTQTYRNAESAAIEAVYSFPLPYDAVLLELRARIDGRDLAGRVAARSEAEQEYEEAVSEGNSAVLLEQAEPGLYTMNLGNLAPGETAEISIRYAWPLSWVGGKLRLTLPTTIAPRYGDPGAGGVAPHQQPASDFAVAYPYGLDIKLHHELAGARVSCPTHSVRTGRSESGTRVTLSDPRAFADRDFVLELAPEAAPQSTVSCLPFEGGHLIHGSFVIPESRSDDPLALKLLVDCSGSMGGDSMDLARRAVGQAIDQLTPGDEFTLSAFGSSVQHAHEQAQPATAANTSGAKFWARRLNANLGGTEMGAALEAVFALPARPELTDVLMITDGEVWNTAALVNKARASGHRIFLVGVGNAPAESVLRQLAEATGGAAAFVTPSEDPGPVIERHLARMRMRRIAQAELIGMPKTHWQTPGNIAARIFPGDTLHLFGACDAAPTGAICLRLSQIGGTTQEFSAAPDKVDQDLAADVSRIGIASRIREMLRDGEHDEAEIRDLGAAHQVMTPYTSYVLVAERDEALSGEPQLRQVPQMLAAGWGGSARTSADIRFSRRDVAESRFIDYAAKIPKVCANRDSGHFDMPEFLLDTGSDISFAATPRSPRELVKHLSKQYSLLASSREMILSIDEAVDHGLPDPVAAFLAALVDAGRSESDVMLAFWKALLRSAVGKAFSRGHRRAILRTNFEQPEAEAALAKAMRPIAAELDADTWPADLDRDPVSSVVAVNRD